MTNQWTTDYHQVVYNTCQRVIGHPFYRYRLQCQLSRGTNQLSIAAPFQVINHIYKYTVNESWQFSNFRGCITRGIFLTLSGFSDVMVKKLLVSKLLQNWRVNHKVYSLFSNYTIPIVTMISAPLFRTTLAHVVEIDSIRMHFMDLLEQVSKEPLSYSSYSPRILLPLFGWKLIHNIIYSTLNKNIPSLAIGNDRSEVVTTLNYFLRHLIISAISDIATYPLETILVRSCLQGIDLVINDVTKGTPIGLESFVSHSSLNILSSLLSKEGYFGLYKGVTTLAIEYAVVCGLTLLVIHLYSKYSPDEYN
ncbi:hypothetical protein LOD99_4923 [Oopsacas minuta]|uniref:Solute carrier family 25 member 46 n=1 Tax=Oopsacas minuta TaxID=111878 RepID=A0AAV7JS92_9METZ|nr:hypothetical protein LOD99_4923 [Oopsacas minuta]